MAGETVQVLCAGAPLQAKATVPVNPVAEVKINGKVAVEPLATLTEVEPLGASVKSTPVPESVVTCDPVPASSFKVKVPLRAPAETGVKPSVNVHAVAGSSVAPQVVAITVKSVLLTAFPLR